MGDSEEKKDVYQCPECGADVGSAWGALRSPLACVLKCPECGHEGYGYLFYDGSFTLGSGNMVHGPGMVRNSLAEIGGLVYRDPFGNPNTSGIMREVIRIVEENLDYNEVDPPATPEEITKFLYEIERFRMGRILFPFRPNLPFDFVFDLRDGVLEMKIDGDKATITRVKE